MFNSNNSTPFSMPVAPIGYGNGGGFGGGWGDDWIALIVLAMVFGYGGFGMGGMNGMGAMGMFWPFMFGGFNGFGGFGGNGSAATQADIQRGFDNQAVVTKLDGITQGICDSTYALNNTITNGFSGVNSALCQGFNGVNTAMLQGFNGVERGFCNLSSQLANCCCDIERGIDGVNYNNAMQTSALQNTMCNNTRDIIDNQNANTRMLYDFMVQSKLDAKDEKIASQAQQITALQFQASQTAQNAYIAANQDAQTAELIRRLGADCPQPAYVVQPPQPVTFPTNCCGGVNYAGYGNGYNNGCGCGNNSGCC